MNKLETIIDPNPNDYFTVKELAASFMMSYSGVKSMYKRYKIIPIKFCTFDFSSQYKKTIFAKAKKLITLDGKRKGQTFLFNKEQKSTLLNIALNNFCNTKIIDPDPMNYLNFSQISEKLNCKQLFTSEDLTKMGIPYVRFHEIRFSTVERKVDFLKQLSKGWRTDKCSNLFVHKAALMGYDIHQIELAPSKVEKQKVIPHSDMPPVLEQLEQIFGKEWQHFGLIKKELKIKEISEMNLTREQLIEKLAEYQA